MKVDTGVDVVHTNPTDPIYWVINSLEKAKSEEELLAILRSNTPLRVTTMTKLYDWKEVLNCFDTIFEMIFTTHGDRLCLQSPSNKSSSSSSSTTSSTSSTSLTTSNMTSSSTLFPSISTSRDYDYDVEFLRVILRFTVSLLRVSFSKDAYGSLDRLMTLLGCYEDDLVELALECMQELAIPPANHRAQHNLGRHITALHKNSASFGEFMEAVEACYTKIPVSEFLSENFTVPMTMRDVVIEPASRFFMVKSDASMPSVKALEEESFHLSDVLSDPRTTRELLETKEARLLSYEHRFTLLWQVRARRLLNTWRNRVRLLSIQYNATSILLNCHSDSSMLYKHYRDRFEILKDFVYFLSTGPGTSSYKPGEPAEVLRLRHLSVNCLSAIVEFRDFNVPPIAVSFPWLLHDLGVSRGQYMGLIPGLLRACASFVVSLNEVKEIDTMIMDSNEVSSNGASHIPTTIVLRNELTPEEQRRVEWMENVLLLVGGLVTVSSSLPTLVDNGLIDDLLSILQVTHTRVRTPDLLCIDSLCVEILENAIGQHVSPLNVFRESHGVDIVISRLCREIDYIESLSLESGRLSAHDNIILQVLFSVLGAYVTEGRNVPDAYTALVRNTDFLGCFERIFSCPKLMTSPIISASLSLFVELINKDQSPPTILNSMLSTRLPVLGLEVGGLNNDTAKYSLPIFTISLISALSLTAEGVEVVRSTDVFRQLFAHFTSETSFVPYSRSLMQSIPTSMGTALEELVRHYPVYLEDCIDAILEVMNKICELSTELLGWQSKHIFPEDLASKNIVSMSESARKEAEAAEAVVYTEKYGMVLNFAVALLSCLEPMLLKSSTAELFLRRGGLDRLLRLSNLALGPSRFMLVGFSVSASIRDAFRGYQPLASVLELCINQLVEHCPTEVMHTFYIHLPQMLSNLKATIDDYWTEHGESGLLESGVERKSPPVKKNGKYCFRLACIFESTPGYALQLSNSDNELSPALLSWCRAVRSIGVLMHLVSVFANVLQHVTDVDALGEEMDDVICPLLELSEALSLELGQARGVRVICGRLSHMAHPTYDLIVTADHAVVRDSPEDGAKRVGRLNKGSRLMAWERVATPSTISGESVVRYRTDHGWISLLRSSGQNDHQIAVVNIIRKEESRLEIELAKNREKLAKSVDAATEFEQLANLSARRGGFVAFQSLQFITLGALVNLCNHFTVTKDLTASLYECNLKPQKFANTAVLHFVRHLDSLLTKSGVDFERYLTAWMEAEKSGKPYTPLQFPVPSLWELDAVGLAVLVFALEFAAMALFKVNSGGRVVEVNSLLIAHMSYGESEGKVSVLRKIIVAAVLLCLCALDPAAGAVRMEGNPALRERIREGKTCPLEWSRLPDEELVAEFNSSNLFPEIIDLSYLENAANDESVYRTYRVVMRERRSMAELATDKTLSFLRFLLQFTSVPASAFDDLLQYHSNENRAINTGVLKRETLLFLVGCCEQLWCQPLLPTLVSSTVKEILDVMGSAKMSVETVKGFPLLSPKPTFAAPKQDELAVSLVIPGGMAFVERPISRRGQRANADQEANQVSRFEPSEELLAAVVEMGFERDMGRRAAQIVHSNDPTEVISVLLENPLLSDQDVEEALAAYNMDMFGDEMDEVSDGEHGVFGSNEDSSDENPFVIVPEREGDRSVNRADAMRTVSTADSNDDDQVITNGVSENDVVPLLPEWQPPLTEVLEAQVECLKSLDSSLLQHVADISLKLLECGTCVPATAVSELDNDGYVRETSTLMVLNQHFRFLKPSLNEGTVRLAQLSWLVKRLSTILSDLLSASEDKQNGEWLMKETEKLGRMRGLLVSILILVHSKATLGPSYCRTAEQFLAFTIRRHPVFVEAYERLAVLSTRTCERLVVDHSVPIDDPTKKNTLGVSPESVQWLTPALILLDSMSQPVLVDHQSVHNFPRKDRFESLDMMYGHLDLEEATFSADIEQLVNKQSADSSTSAVGVLSLPLIPSPLSIHARQSLAVATSDLLPWCSIHLGNKALYNLPLAVCHILLHLLSDETVRTTLSDRQLHLHILRTRCKIDKLPSLCTTILQRLSEDRQSLRQSMRSVFRAAYERLAHPRGGDRGTNLHSFVEVTAPLLVRDQTTYLEVLHERFILENSCLTLRKEPLTSSQLSAHMSETSSVKVDIQPPVDVATTGEEAPPTKKARRDSLSRKTPIQASSAAPNTHSVATAVTCGISRSQLVGEIVGEICRQAIEKWELARHLSTLEAVPETPAETSSLTLASLLTLLADLVASVPTFAIISQRHSITNTSVISQNHAMAIARGENCVMPRGVSIVSFVTNCLISRELQTDRPGGLNTAILDVEGNGLDETCCYFLAAQMSRAGEGRKLVLEELSRWFTPPPESSPAASGDIWRHMARFADLVAALLDPPQKWARRDYFLVPVREIAMSMGEVHLDEKMIALMSAVDVSNPYAQTLCTSLAVPIHLLMCRFQNKQREKLRSRAPNSSLTDGARHDTPSTPRHQRGNTDADLDLSPAEDRLGHLLAPNQVGALGSDEDSDDTSSTIDQLLASADESDFEPVRESEGESDDEDGMDMADGGELFAGEESDESEDSHHRHMMDGQDDDDDEDMMEDMEEVIDDDEIDDDEGDIDDDDDEILSDGMEDTEDFVDEWGDELEMEDGSDIEGSEGEEDFDFDEEESSHVSGESHSHLEGDSADENPRRRGTESDELQSDDGYDGANGGGNDMGSRLVAQLNDTGVLHLRRPVGRGGAHLPIEEMTQELTQELTRSLIGDLAGHTLSIRMENGEIIPTIDIDTPNDEVPELRGRRLATASTRRNTDINTSNFLSTHGGENTSTSVPFYHPLLTFADARCSRQLGSANSNAGTSLRQLQSFGVLSQASSFYMLNAHNRYHRTAASAPRRALGPLVSDRRWGTDVNSPEAMDARLDILTSAVERGWLAMFGPSLQSDMRNESKKNDLSAILEKHLRSQVTGSAAPHLNVSIVSPTEVAPESSGESDSDDDQFALEFVESLDPNLRANFLVNADEDILSNLPEHIRREAHELQIRAGLNNNVTGDVHDSHDEGDVHDSHDEGDAHDSHDEGDAHDSHDEGDAHDSHEEDDAMDEDHNIDSDNESKNNHNMDVSVSPSWKKEWMHTLHPVDLSPPPFDVVFVTRLFGWVLSCRTETLPLALMKLLVAAIRFADARRLVIRLGLALLVQRYDLVKRVIKSHCKFYPHMAPKGDTEKRALKKFESLIDELSRAPNPVSSTVHVRKFLAVVAFLFKKASSLVWYELLRTPKSSGDSNSEDDDVWVFSQLLSMLPVVMKTSNVDLEAVLHLLEKLCRSLSDKSITTLNEIAAYRLSNKDPDAANLETAISRLFPAPLLTDTEAAYFSAVVAEYDCSANGRKTLMRTLRSLSLIDVNWHLLLDHISTSAANLVKQAALQCRQVHEVLSTALSNQQSALKTMNHPLLAGTAIVWEARLLNALRLMTVLRARSGPNAANEAEVVASYMARIPCDSLWDALSDCLDVVREIEGIAEEELESAGGPSTAAAAAASAAKLELEKSASALTTRFIPLIECFLTVVGKKLRPPSLNEEVMDTTTSNAIPGPIELTRTTSLLPGSRFRTGGSFLSMQMEVSEESESNRLVAFVSKNRVLLNMILRTNVHLLDSSFLPLVAVPRCRALLHFDIKRAYFRSRLKKMRQSASRYSPSSQLRFTVRRSRVFEESFHSLRYKSADEMRKRLNVTFHGEEGVDAGGVTREWYAVLSREIFNPNYALFVSLADNVTFQPNPRSYVNPDHLDYFKFIGRVIGKAICDGFLLDAHFTRSFYKHILGLSVTMHDLEAIEPDYYKSLTQILETPLEYLCLDLTFTAETTDFGVTTTVDLIPGGSEIAVTDDNKHEYVRLIAHHRMTSAIRKQIDAFLDGFHELVPPELISLFDAQELELLISGLPDIDLDDLRGNTDYHGYKPTDPIIGWFWNILRSFSKEERALFLQFVTGTSKVPLDGFKALQGSDGVKRFNIHKAFGGTHLLPSAHTCFNQLDLVEYPSEEVFREKLLLSMREGSEGFGFA